MEIQMPTDEINVLELSEEECASKVAPFWNDADVHSHYPAVSKSVCEILREGAGLDVTDELLETWARSKQVGQVAVRHGKFAWSHRTFFERLPWRIHPGGGSHCTPNIFSS